MPDTDNPYSPFTNSLSFMQYTIGTMDIYEYDDYADYEEGFFPRSRKDRRQRSGRNGRPAEAPVTLQEMLDADMHDETAFDPSFMRDKTEDFEERLWLIRHLQGFYEEEYITDALYNVKGGKEASVYCCLAHPSLETSYVAAKIYRPAFARSLKNDALYREGRYVNRRRGSKGTSLMDERMARAIAKRTGFGKDVLISTWIGHEYQMMLKLYDAGVHLPEPIGHKSHAILMEYMGEGHIAAPPLHYITLDDDEAQPLFHQLLQDVALMLANDVIHGDFSAYNILYWEGAVKIIDFPQAVDPNFNPSALQLLQRDVTRLCQYFSPYGVVDLEGREPDPVQISTDLWARYMNNSW